MILAQSDPVSAPAVDWAGLVPLIILAGGALLIVMARSVVKRLGERAEAIAITSVGPLSVLGMWLAAAGSGNGWPLSGLRGDIGEPGFLACLAVAMVLAALAVRALRIGIDAAVTVGLGLAALAAIWALWTDRLSADGAFEALEGQLDIDGFMLVFSGVSVAGVVLVALLLDGYLRREGLVGAEMYALMLISAAGGVVMAGAGDLIVLFLGLETLSIAAYVMAAMHVRRSESTEAGMKYFVLGAVASAFLLYGIAMVYGATGSTSLAEIAVFLGTTPLLDQGLLAAGFALLLVGLGFKVAAVPFHSWTPDVYAGSPTPVVAFMASAVKVAGFAALLRVFVVAFADYRDDWRPALMALAALSLVAGSVLAVVQHDVKRMLAYSSIVHTGFILLGVAAGGDGVPAVVFYAAAYAFMVIGSFGVVALLSGRGDRATSLDDFDGLAVRLPAAAAAFTILLLAQAGVPFTTGFVAKFGVIGAAVDSGSYWLAALAMLAAVVSAFVYLRIVLSMYLGSPRTQAASADAGAAGTARAGTTAAATTGSASPDPQTAQAAGQASATVEGPAAAEGSVPRGALLAVTVTVVVTIVLGIVPGPLDELARDALPVLAGGG